MDGYDEEEDDYFATECSVCGLICEHDDVYLVFTGIDEQNCDDRTYCSLCNMEFTEWYNQGEHSFEDGVCVGCGWVCEHDFERYGNSNDDGTHEAYDWCFYCHLEIYLGTFRCFADGSNNGPCNECGYICPHQTLENTEYCSYDSGTHYFYKHCAICEKPIITRTSPSDSDVYVSGCGNCGFKRW